MGLIARDTGGGEDFAPCPAGNTLGYCFQVIDLGTHTSEWQGKTRTLRKCRLVFETAEHLHEFKEGEGEQPYAVGKEYTLSLGPKANLFKDLQSWRGKQFTPEELKGFDLQKVLGAPALINIVHEAAKTGGKTYANIETIAAIPKAMKNAGLIPMKNKPVFYTIDMGRDCEQFKALPEWVQKKISESHEFTGKPTTGGKGGPPPDGEEGDDIPF